MNRILEVYYDQDGVLNRFAEKVIEIYNQEHGIDYDWRQNKSYYWDNTGLDKDYINAIIDRPNVFGTAQVEPGAQEYMKLLMDEGFGTGILTLPRWNEHCPGEKVTWIKEFFPFVDLRNIHMTHKKEKFATAISILLDDSMENLERWQDAGGIAIAYAQGWNEEWEGYRVNSHEEFYRLVHLLENAFNGKGIAMDALQPFIHRPVKKEASNG